MITSVSSQELVIRKEKNLLEEISLVLENIQSLETDWEAKAGLAEIGYDEAWLARGTHLCQEVQSAYARLLEAIAARDKAKALLYHQFMAAKEAFNCYRLVVKTVITDETLRLESGLTEKTPGDMNAFILVARSAYRYALNLPAYQYLSLFPASGSSPNALEEGSSALHALQAADDAHEMAKAMVVDATIEFEIAEEAYREWVHGFRKIREQSELQKTA